MAEAIADIQSPRLILRHLPAKLLELSLEGRLDEVAAALGAKLPPAWLEEKDFMEMRLGDYRADPLYRPWGVRVAILRKTGEAVARLSYHTRPGPDYLKPFAEGGIEFGYTVFHPHRGQGYATEIAQVLMDHAREQGVPRFCLSVSPTNAPSLAIVKKLGFKRVGEHMDEVDGLEYIFAREA